MNYIFTEKFIRPGLKVQNVYPKVVLVADPQPEICSIYLRHFNDASFITQVCNKYETLAGILRELDPHLLVLTLTPLKTKAEATVKKIMVRHPFMRIITLARTESESDPRRLLGLGVVGHLNKELTRPQDIVTLAQHVLSF